MYGEGDSMYEKEAEAFKYLLIATSSFRFLLIIGKQQKSSSHLSKMKNLNKVFLTIQFEFHIVADDGNGGYIHPDKNWQ